MTTRQHKQQTDTPAQEPALDDLRAQLDEARAQRDALQQRIDELSLELQALGGEDTIDAPDADDALRDEVEQWQSKYKRALADFQNYQRRAVENETSAREAGVRSVVERLLSVMDNFDLALGAEGATPDQIVQGVGVIRDEMRGVLGALGLAPIDASPNDEFDPQRHQAMTQMPGEGVDPGRISAVLQRGYALGDRVVRPAKVAIAPAQEEAGESADSGSGDESGDDEGA